MENTTTPAVTPSSVGIRYGVLLGIVSIIFSLLLFMTNSDQSPLRWAGLLISVAAIWLAHGYFKKHNGGFMSFGQGLTIGLVMSVVSGVLSSIFSYIYMTFIDPSYMERLMEKTRTEMEAKGTMSDEQIDQAMSMMNKFSGGPMTLVFGILGALIIGLLISLIVSAITKHNRPEFE
ncbi:DUF4199 domain-containing protein [Hymenobacter busanensis]|uniref:DUF4199 domain-containing protein n=1 Tax=Hymenobacter busanensis TaxID=2607656 RepID=A0A7L5A107_9BACT|nr:DUF4199 domain-containing protein [Hymenobacter busanensis]KAA9327004.1 DUF4199 domain-containing protein [Hymenobacter busanensis]QHJ09454.1 DUF4199 family protein [Hymenobacter busanensis]